MTSATARKQQKETDNRSDTADVVSTLMQEISILREQLEHQSDVIKDLERQTREDSLTGLANRRAFEEELTGSMSYFRRYGRPGAVLVIDVNAFKSVNDSLGHAAGDAILKHIARLLESHTRDTDLVARIGGDEFCIILREAAGEAAMMKAAELEAVVSNFPCTHEGREIYTSISVGVCSFQEATDITDLMEKADEAMYERKQEKSPVSARS